VVADRVETWRAYTFEDLVYSEADLASYHAIALAVQQVEDVTVRTSQHDLLWILTVIGVATLRGYLIRVALL